MWYIIFCEEDSSHSVIHEKFVVKTGKLSVGDEVAFYYSKQSYIGRIVSMSEDREKMDDELSKLGAKARRVSKRVEEDSMKDIPVTGKRRSQPPVKLSYGSVDTNSKDKKKVNSEDETVSKRQRILNLNKETAARYSNSSLLNIITKNKEKDKDIDWQPAGEKESEDEDSDGSSVISEVVTSDTKKTERKREKSELVSGIMKIDKSFPDVSPTKEALKIQLAELQRTVREFKSGQSMDKEKKSNEIPKHLFYSGGNDKVECQNNLLGQSAKSDSGSDKELFESSDQNTSELCKEEEKDLQEVSNDEIKKAEADFSDDEVSAQEQLYGKEKDTMLLSGNVYCLKAVLSHTLNKATNVSHVARGLLLGVFKLSAFQTCTLTGQAWRAGGAKEGESQGAPKALSPTAVAAIITYSKGVAEEKKWRLNKDTTKIIKHSMSQRVGEIKRMIKKKGLKAVQQDLLQLVN